MWNQYVITPVYTVIICDFLLAISCLVKSDGSEPEFVGPGDKRTMGECLFYH